MDIDNVIKKLYELFLFTEIEKSEDTGLYTECRMISIKVRWYFKGYKYGVCRYIPLDLLKKTEEEVVEIIARDIMDTIIREGVKNERS